MAETFTISEISRMVSLPTHTIRYYEKQFPNLLNVSRSKGGHRKYEKRHLVALKEIIRLLKQENLSIRKTKQILGEEENEEEIIEGLVDDEMQIDKLNSKQLAAMLMSVIKRLDVISETNIRQQKILEILLNKSPFVNEDDLLKHIDEYRLVKNNIKMLNGKTIGFI